MLRGDLRKKTPLTYPSLSPSPIVFLLHILFELLYKAYTPTTFWVFDY